MGCQGQDALISAARRDSRLPKRSGDMSDLLWLIDAQMARLEPFFPKSHGKPRVDDKRVLSGIIFINRNGLRWRDAPATYGPHSRRGPWPQWGRASPGNALQPVEARPLTHAAHVLPVDGSEKGIFARMMLGLATEHGEEKTVMIDSTCLKAHRTPTSMAAKKGARSSDRSLQGPQEHKTARHMRQSGAAAQPVCWADARSTA
jgi:transposase